MTHGPGRGIENQSFEIDGVEFVAGWIRPSEPCSLTLMKAPRLVEEYRRLFAPFDRPRVVELGIAHGGSVALLALLAQPERMVALDISDTPVEALEATLAQRGLADVVHTHYGVDQGDRDRLRDIVRSEFGTSPLDVVVDDASHLYWPSLASFEVLFPLLAPGGAYVIEDWAANDQLAAAWANVELTPEVEHRIAAAAAVADRARPLSLLVLQAVLAQAESPGVVAAVEVGEDWTLLRRGPEPLDPERFALSDVVADRYGLLPAPPG